MITVNLDVMMAKRKISLGELAEKHTPPVTKSCVNRRLNRLIALSKE